jgi:ABC-2 type transport system ATP-binding protein
LSTCAEGSDRSIVAEGIARYFADVKAVDGIDLRVDSGRIFGFLGPNGSGKTTMVRVLTTILAPTFGRAWVAGLNVTERPQEVRAKIGVALQDVGLDDIMTARELLVLQSRLFGTPAAEAVATAERLLKTVGLDDVGAKKRIGQYSGGMKRRLDLALALVHDPLVLFLDEPTTGLDPASRLGIWEEVRRLNQDQGMTIFLTTQYLEEADRLADEVAIINKGKIVAQGTPRQLKKEIGDQVVALSFDSDDWAADAGRALAELCPERRLAGKELFCFYPQAADTLPALIRKLDESAIPLGGLVLSEPTLDDVFLLATGARMGGAASVYASSKDGLEPGGLAASLATASATIAGPITSVAGGDRPTRPAEDTK